MASSPPAGGGGGEGASDAAGGVVGKRLKDLEALISKYEVPVPTDYLYDLPKGMRRHAFTDKGHKSGLLQIALTAATTQVFGRPFEDFTEDQVRRSFHLGDTEGAPPGSPPRAGVEVPRPMYRRAFHPQAMDEAEALTHKAAALAAAAARGEAPPPAKRPRAEEPAVGVAAVAPAAVAPAVAPVPAPAPPAAGAAAAAAATAAAPPVRAPSPVLVLPQAPAVDLSKLAGRRRVSDLSHPEVITIAEEITKKLRARKSRQWRKQNPLDVDITRENCAAMGIPQYFDVIQTPMNLQIINRKVRAMEYRSLPEFVADVELMVSNALTFNRPGDAVHTFAAETREVFLKLLKKHKDEYALLDDDE